MFLWSKIAAKYKIPRLGSLKKSVWNSVGLVVFGFIKRIPQLLESDISELDIKPCLMWLIKK